MGSQYKYQTPSGGPPNNGVPPGVEPPQGNMVCPSFQFCAPQPPPCGAQYCPPQFGSPPFGSPPFGLPFGPLAFGPPPFGQPMCFPTPGPPPPGPGPMMCFPTEPPGPPPPYALNPWSHPWGHPVPVRGPQLPTKANERPPPGARVNGKIVQMPNQAGHIFSNKVTTLHLTLDGVKPWNWGSGGSHRFQVYTAASSMPIDEFIEQIGAIQNAPPGTPREQIGIQEAIEQGDGHWLAGAAFRLGDPKTVEERADGTLGFKTVGDLGYTAERGLCERGKPVTIVLLP